MRGRIVVANLEIAKKKLHHLDFAEKKFVEGLDKSIKAGNTNPRFIGQNKFNKLTIIAEKVG